MEAEDTIEPRGKLRSSLWKEGRHEPAARERKAQSTLSHSGAPSCFAPSPFPYLLAWIAPFFSCEARSLLPLLLGSVAPASLLLLSLGWVTPSLFARLSRSFLSRWTTSLLPLLLSSDAPSTFVLGVAPSVFWSLFLPLLGWVALSFCQEEGTS